MKLIGYIRVSSESQEDNQSFGVQTEAIEKYCKAMNHELIAIFTEVESAKNMKDRPEFQQVLMALDIADGIIAYKLDRVSRSVKDTMTLVEDILTPNNKSLIVLDVNLDISTGVGKAMLTMASVFAEMERHSIKERTAAGRARKHSLGGYAYGSPQFGFKAVSGQLEPSPEEQLIIQQIKNHRRSGKSYQNIVDWLTINQIPSKRGFAWSKMMVRNIIIRGKKVYHESDKEIKKHEISQRGRKK